MGTDIHCFLERNSGAGWIVDPGHQVDEGGDLKEIASLSGRSYYFFGLVAGVRSVENKQVAPVRGLPKNVSPEVKAASTRDWHHGQTYLSPAELAKAFKKYAGYQIKEYWNFYPLEHTFTMPAEDTFTEYGLTDAVLKYIRSYQDNEKIENILLGTSKKTRFRIVIWFDS